MLRKLYWGYRAGGLLRSVSMVFAISAQARPQQALHELPIPILSFTSFKYYSRRHTSCAAIASVHVHKRTRVPRNTVWCPPNHHF